MTDQDRTNYASLILRIGSRIRLHFLKSVAARLRYGFALASELNKSESRSSCALD